VKLLQNFWSYLNEEGRHKDLVMKALKNIRDPELIGKRKEHTHDDVVLVRKWVQTRHATIFRMSNKLVQVVFNDATEILLGGSVSDFSKEVVTFVNRKGKRINYLLKNALEEDDKDFVKKLRYSKDIILSMLDREGGSQKASEKPTQRTEMASSKVFNSSSQLITSNLEPSYSSQNHSENPEGGHSLKDQKLSHASSGSRPPSQK